MIRSLNDTMTNVELMLFDLDGTLIDSKKDLAASINLMLTDLGRSALSEDTVGGFVGDGVRVLVYRSLTATDPGRRPPDERLHAEGIALMHSHYQDQMLKTTRLYEGVADGFVIDDVDGDLRPAIELLGQRVLVTSTVMGGAEDRARLAREILDFAQTLAGARVEAR